MLQLCVSVSIETRARRVMYLTAAHTLYLLIESWLFTAPDLFACTRKNESRDESSSFQQPSPWYFAVISGCLFVSTTAYSSQIIPRQCRTLHLRRVLHRVFSAVILFFNIHVLLVYQIYPLIEMSMIDRERNFDAEIHAHNNFVFIVKWCSVCCARLLCVQPVLFNMVSVVNFTIEYFKHQHHNVTTARLLCQNYYR